jgi:hypothetical protein
MFPFSEATRRTRLSVRVKKHVQTCNNQSHTIYSVKLRRPGVGSNFVLHKYFYQREKVWQDIRDEENADDIESGIGADAAHGADNEAPSTSKGPLEFDPIDSRHLSSLPLVRSRVMKLLNHCPGGTCLIKSALPAIASRATKPPPFCYSQLLTGLSFSY